MANRQPSPAEQLFPSQGNVSDRAGLPVDATSWVWIVDQAVVRKRLDFKRLQIASADILRATAMYMAEKLKTASVDSIGNTFEALTYLKRSEHFRHADDSGTDLGESLIADLRAVSEFSPDRLHYIRAWYCWCANHGLRPFSERVAERLRELKISGNETGRAVRTQDPVSGAFDELEFIALTTKLRALGPTLLTTQENALTWLALAVGSNPLAFALTREADLKTVKEPGTGRIYAQLNIPRIKKEDDLYRAQFHPKHLNDEMAAWMTKLIVENQAFREREGWPEGCAFPLFRRASPDQRRLGGLQHEFAMHMSSNEITETIKSSVAKLGIVSHRTGEPLVVTTTRFRRTYGTRAVEEGASPSELAVMLDHSDLGTVQVYFETRANQVHRLDAALALHLAPIADAFMGRIVSSEQDAVNGGNPAKRIPWYRRHPDRLPEKKGDLGTCGSGPCGLFAPISCYTCAKFQPWLDAPHREVLDWLCADRERKQQDGLDQQIVGIHDATILAVAEVVATCEGAGK